jgi:hypothetical protein
VPKRGKLYQIAKKLPNDHKIYQMDVIYISNGHRITQHLSFKVNPKFTQIRIFCLKAYHLATPVSTGLGIDSKLKLNLINFALLRIVFDLPMNSLSRFPCLRVGRRCEKSSQNSCRPINRCIHFQTVFPGALGLGQLTSREIVFWRKGMKWGVLSEKLGRRVRLTLLFSNEQDTIFLHVKHNWSRLSRCGSLYTLHSNGN